MDKKDSKYVSLNISSSTLDSAQSKGRSRKSLWRVSLFTTSPSLFNFLLLCGFTTCCCKHYIYILLLQWWNQLSRFQRTLFYVIFLGVLLTLIYMWPSIRQEPMIISIETAPSPAESLDVSCLLTDRIKYAYIMYAYSTGLLTKLCTCRVVWKMEHLCRSEER